MLQPNALAIFVFILSPYALNINLKFGCMVQYILIMFAVKPILLVVSERIALLVGVFTRNCRSCVNELSVPEQILFFCAFLILCLVGLLTLCLYCFV